MATTGGSVFAPQLSQGIGGEILRTFSRRSRFTNESLEDEDDNNEKLMSAAEDWELMGELKAYRQTLSDSKLPKQRLGVTWCDLTVKGIATDAVFQENAVSQWNILQKIRDFRQPKQLKTLIDSSSGCIKPGEMLLVLGRPGAGCTTLLKMLANRRAGYAEVSGDIRWGAMERKEVEKYSGQIAMNTEEEVFYPTLTVSQTLDFATRLKVSSNMPDKQKSLEHYRLEFKDFLLRAVGIAHTSDTKIGNEYVRGISGGERKRVSIIETLVTQASVYCWDNSTRGLDASTALEYAKAIRAITDKLGLASIATLYQASNDIYNLFDKVLVLDQGAQIFYGPRQQAKSFVEDMGFVCDDAANVADFLTGITVPTERTIREGHEASFPRSFQAVRDIHLQSDIREAMRKELNYPGTHEAKTNTEEFRRGVHLGKAKGLQENSSLTVSFPTQVKACIIRQYQIIWTDKATFFIKQASTLIQALVAGSLFYNAQDNSSGLFTKGGTLFFSLLFNCLLSMSEVTDSFSGRPILSKHKSFRFYNPAAFCLAQIASDIPVLLFQISVFSIVIYFMVGLEQTAGAFFTFWFVIYLTTFVMTAFFRAIGASFSGFDGASRVSGFAISALTMYTGYMIIKPEMHPWFVWLFWIDPLAYAFESLLGNEFRDTVIPCVNNNLVPNGPGYLDARYQACAGVGGALPGATSVTGDQYLASLSYSTGHIWRNVGILFAWWFLFVAITVFFTLRWDAVGGSRSSQLIPRENAKTTKHLYRVEDEESKGIDPPSEASKNIDHAEKPGSSNQASGDMRISRSTSVFTWRNLTYTVNTPSGPRVLLDDVQGYVKPGMLGALMGSSGAGKTTLLDVLAQRKTEGTIHGEILVDGRPLPVSFQRSAGYCEQLDVHEPLTTVREALEFSALLRQSRDTPREQKLAYVDVMIDLLELHDIEHTLIGKTGMGLSVEQRKRVTIGVELVSKPSILIFLDEPTSGLDGQAAYNTVRFLRKLADLGQAVLVTIHQPSAQLFAQFDTLLLLAKGGKTVYFGDIGENADTIKAYFARYGAPCPRAANPAVHMIDVCSGSLSHGMDWNKVWLDSPEHALLRTELDRTITDAANKPPRTTDDGHEFACTLWDQFKLVTQRMNVSLFRNTEYTNNKILLHVGSALFNGFSFWMIGDSVHDQQLRLFAIFNFIFVAPGVIAQLQPGFIAHRDVYDTREKKSRMYSWVAFVVGQIVSELPYLVICAVLYFVCYYYTVGFPADSNKAGAFFFVMLIYEFIYTGIGQFVAAYAPNAVFASLCNPLVIGVLISFAGVLVPYSQIQIFWRYWLYYLNPFNYLMGALLVFADFDTSVKCSDGEFARFSPPSGETCAAYLADYLHGLGSRANLVNPDATADCRVCEYQRGSDYLYTLNLIDYFVGWRDAAICVIFALSSYSMVFLLMKLRTKASKTAT